MQNTIGKSAGSSIPFLLWFFEKLRKDAQLAIDASQKL